MNCRPAPAPSSPAAVRAVIREIIAAENADAPLSDVSVAQLLHQQGIRVARRTVSKYRGMMHLPSAELRRTQQGRRPRLSEQACVLATRQGAPGGAGAAAGHKKADRSLPLHQPGKDPAPGFY